MLPPVLVTAPAEMPVTLAELKAQVSETSDDWDDLLTIMLGAAVSHLDGWSGVLGRALVTQTWRQDFKRFDTKFPLYLAPVASITSLTYRDDDGTEQTVPAENYELVHEAPYSVVRPVSGYSWPALQDRTAPVSITYVAGYGGAAAVPAALKQAILLHAATMFAYRETLAERVSPTMAYESLVSPYRRQI